MPTFKLPLSGNVLQAINPWMAFTAPIGSQAGLFNVTIGQSSEPEVEADVLSDVASYGKQLGRIGDALVVLLNHFHPRTPLTEEETAAIEDLRDMLQRIADVKGKHKRKALRPSAHHAPAPEPIASPASPPFPPHKRATESPPPRTGENSLPHMRGSKEAAPGTDSVVPAPVAPAPVTTPRRTPRSAPRRPS
jgi:hypothetical protein